MELNVVYFYTVAIVDWMQLINTDKFKHIVMDSLIYLIKKNKLKVYGFVIMPNHIHPALFTNKKIDDLNG